MITHREDSIDKARLSKLLKEVSLRDYQVIKACRYGVGVESMYPGHTSWYESKMVEIHRLEALLAESTDTETGSAEQPDKDKE